MYRCCTIPFLVALNEKTYKTGQLIKQSEYETLEFRDKLHFHQMHGTAGCPKGTYWDWDWYWGINQDINVCSPPKRFNDFDEMKEYSSQHSLIHQWLPGY